MTISGKHVNVYKKPATYLVGIGYVTRCPVSNVVTHTAIELHNKYD